MWQFFFMGVSGEKISADSVAAKYFSQKFQSYIKDSKSKILMKMGYILNFYTRKTILGFKRNKGIISETFSSNARGIHKLLLFSIGKSMKHCAFKNGNITSLPLYCKAQKSAWIDGFLFKSGLSTGLLVFGNVLSHPGKRKSTSCSCSLTLHARHNVWTRG